MSVLDKRILIYYGNFLLSHSHRKKTIYMPQKYLTFSSLDVWGFNMVKLTSKGFTCHFRKFYVIFLMYYWSSYLRNEILDDNAWYFLIWLCFAYYQVYLSALWEPPASVDYALFSHMVQNFIHFFAINLQVLCTNSILSLMIFLVIFSFSSTYCRS